ncbi:MAG: hypothetical protein K0S47_1639 [Herbinix sp.]|jgi:hypothetical protein|nr:hypothetical protein [Herbinix sp.]
MVSSPVLCVLIFYIRNNIYSNKILREKVAYDTGRKSKNNQ